MKHWPAAACMPSDSQARFLPRELPAVRRCQRTIAISQVILLEICGSYSSSAFAIHNNSSQPGIASPQRGRRRRNKTGTQRPRDRAQAAGEISCRSAALQTLKNSLAGEPVEILPWWQVEPFLRQFIKAFAGPRWMLRRMDLTVRSRQRGLQRTFTTPPAAERTLQRSSVSPAVSASTLREPALTPGTPAGPPTVPSTPVTPMAASMTPRADRAGVPSWKDAHSPEGAYSLCVAELELLG